VTAWELCPALVHDGLVSAEVGCPFLVAALAVQRVSVIDRLLCGGPINAVDTHEVVVDLLQVNHAFHGHDPRAPDMHHRTTGLTDCLDAGEFPDAGRVVVLPLLMAQQPRSRIAADLTVSRRSIQGGLANLVPLTVGEQPVQAFTPQWRRDEFNFELHSPTVAQRFPFVAMAHRVQ